MNFQEIFYLSYQIKKGSEKHFKLFFQKTQGIVFGVCAKMGLSQEDSEEIVQDTYIQFWRQRETLNEKDGVLGLLKIIAKRLVYKKLNAKKEVISLSAIPEKEDKEVNNKEQPIDKELLEKYLEELPKNQGLIIRLFYLQGLSNEEISDYLNISIRTVENSLYRAKLKLKQQFKDENIRFSTFLNE